MHLRAATHPFPSRDLSLGSSLQISQPSRSLQHVYAISQPRSLRSHANSDEFDNGLELSDLDPPYVSDRYANASAETAEVRSTRESTTGQAENNQGALVECFVEVAADTLPLNTSVPLDISTSGIIWALSVIIGVRLGRTQSESARLDVWSKDWTAETLIQDQTLLRRRREFQIEESRKKEEDAARRLEVSKIRAAEKAEARAAREAIQEVAAEAEAQKLRSERDSKKATYQAAEEKLKQELTLRINKEKQLLAEKEQTLAEERLRKAREEEVKVRLALEARLAREAEERAAQEEARRARQEERRQLRQLQQRFAVRIEGTVRVCKPPKGAQTAERFPQDATVEIAIIMRTAVGGDGETVTQRFGSLDDARASCIALTGLATRSATDRYESAVRLQAMAEQGPLLHMDDVELQHWMHISGSRATVSGCDVLQGLLATPLGRDAEKQQDFQSRTEHAVLPLEHPQRTSTLLERAVAAVEGSTPAHVAQQVLHQMMEEEDAAFYQGAPAAAPPHLGAIMVLAHFIDRMLAGRPARQSDAPAWFEEGAALVRRELRELTQGGLKDSLSPVAEYVEAALGGSHPVAREMRLLAVENQSAAARIAQAERQRLIEANIAAALLEEEWPDSSDIAAERAAAREANTPLPERIWALRNVAATLALGGPGELARARQLLEKAVQLKQESVGDAAEHPVILPELDALGDVLARKADWADDLRAIRARQLRILQLIAARYQSVGQVVSAVVLLEAAIREFEEALGLRHPGILALSKRAESMFEALTPEDRQEVAAKRREVNTVQAVTDAFSEGLAAHSATAGTGSKSAVWDRGGIEPLPIL